MQLSFKEKVFFSRQVTQAIVFMHMATPPVVHLDIKPDNILAIELLVVCRMPFHCASLLLVWVEDGSNHVFVVDFGLGKVLGESCALGTATKVAGTPGFQAPEKL